MWVTVAKLTDIQTLAVLFYWHSEALFWYLCLSWKFFSLVKLVKSKIKEFLHLSKLACDVPGRHILKSDEVAHVSVWNLINVVGCIMCWLSSMNSFNLLSQWLNYVCIVVMWLKTHATFTLNYPLIITREYFPHVWKFSSCVNSLPWYYYISVYANRTKKRLLQNYTGFTKTIMSDEFCKIVWWTY